MTQAIDEVLDRFDFRRVRSAMLALRPDLGPHAMPIEHLRRIATRLLQNVLLGPAAIDAHGGFIARKVGRTLRLTFVLAVAEAEIPAQERHAG